MPNCYVCNSDITEDNSTEEHILLNSMGGRLKSTRLICKNCNSKFGNTFDSELSDQLNFLATILMIKRDRGTPPPILMERKSTGEKLSVDHEGKPRLAKPTVEQCKVGEATHIRIQARDMNEARQILNGLKRKYPTIDVEEQLASAKVIEEHLDEHLNMKLVIGGKTSLPAILKMAINYYIERTGDLESLSNAIDNLKKNDSSRVEPIILKERLFCLDNGEVTHSIFINGNKDSHRLYAIIELYNVFQFVVRLSDSYTRDDFTDLYVYDVLERAEKKKTPTHVPEFDLIFNHSYPSSDPDFAILRQALERCMGVAMQRQHDFFRKEMIKDCWESTVDKMIPQGSAITQEALDAFQTEFMNKLRPYLLSMMKR